MFLALNTLAQNYPVSKWTEEGLMAAGITIGWNSIARKRSSTTSASWIPFRTENTPSTANGVSPGLPNLNRQPDADDRLTTFLLKYPVSANSVDALYWLGRNAERVETLRTRAAITAKLVERSRKRTSAMPRLPASQAWSRRRKSAELLEKIPPPPHCVLLMSRSRWPPWTAGLARRPSAPSLRRLRRAGAEERILCDLFAALPSGSRAGGFRSRSLRRRHGLRSASSCRISNPGSQRFCPSPHGRPLYPFPTKRRCAAKPPKTISIPCLPLASFARNPRFRRTRLARQRGSG